MFKLLFVSFVIYSLKVEGNKNYIVTSDPVIETIFLKALASRLLSNLQCLIMNGDAVLGIPALDPFKMKRIEFDIPSDIVNLKLEVNNILISGISRFIVETSNFDVVEMILDLDLVLPLITFEAYTYELKGEIMNAIPMQGLGTARFDVNDLRIQGKLHFNNSENSKLLLDRIDNATFFISSLKSGLTGIIAGKVIDESVNTVVNNVIIEYVDKFRVPIIRFAVTTIMNTLNPILEKIDLKYFLNKIYDL